MLVKLEHAYGGSKGKFHAAGENCKNAVRAEAIRRQSAVAIPSPMST